ncbi:MAG TPA: thiosulfate oxidation carrier protein SoxY [Burkholderiales bacterium]|nr:thiosulfate oxidation carrier protein SoxY [Burkholderiales bacterium]
MRQERREFLRLLPLMAAVGLLPAAAVRAEEWNKAAFEAKKMDDVVRMLGGSAPQPSSGIVLIGPEIAENGAVVPLEIESKLPDTRSIAILIEKNPNILAAQFTLPSGTLPWLQTRVKMAETCNVYALAKAGGKFYYAAKEIKVTLGGCGG